jgi:hypothetical protein
MDAALAKHGKDLLRLIRTHEIIGQDPLDVLYSLRNHFRLIRTAILAKKELQHINWHICPFLDLLRQILPDGLSVEMLTELILDNFSSIIRLRKS